MAMTSGLDIVVAGGGTAGWMAAAALARFLEDGSRITLVESDVIGTVGVGEATIPQIHNYNAALGIDEREFLAATQGTFKLGIEFGGWRAPDHSYIHAFGSVGRGSGLMPFRQLWLRARAEGLAGELGDYVLNSVAAYARRMAGPAGRPSAIPDPVYAYHFDASLYAAFLRRYAEQRRVTRVEGRIERVEQDPESGDVAALQLDGDRRIAADLFIDCTGFRSLLLGQTLGVRFDDWSDWLPNDRALAVPCERSHAFRPYTQSLARKAGWQWRIPLQHRTGNGHVYCSSAISDDEAAAILLADLDGEALDEPRPLRFTAGRRREAWAGNVVALGLAAGFMEPLESTSIHLVQSGIARLMSFLPRDRNFARARSSFNGMTASEWERIRDFLILHYKANGRVGEPFWDQCRAMPIPDTLAAKMALFEEAGAIFREDGELFTEEGWGQVMIGQGLKPRSWSPLADVVTREELEDYMKTLALAYQRKTQSMPAHADYVATLLGSPQLQKDIA
ncbi:tryptophan halogenase family protein [Sphingomonas sp. LHG3406-1]|uniref:tryptophan halogenase family protein n=1 Tax=Sphingomonas sp. LHG3406-1 TaxID=2804617 RepID=UPI0026028B5B|nr:tryptophan halogenase family protein [Sphingomonas sp. LHG3406-1]